MEDLRTVRKRKKITQMELSKLTGIYQPHLSWIENGRTIPNEETREKIIKALGEEVDFVKTRLKAKRKQTLTPKKIQKLINMLNDYAENE